MMRDKPLPVLQEANLDQLVLLDEVRVAPDGGEDNDPPLLALELLCGSHHHIGRVSQLISDLLTLPPDIHTPSGLNHMQIQQRKPVGRDDPNFFLLHVEVLVL